MKVAFLSFLFKGLPELVSLYSILQQEKNWAKRTVLTIQHAQNIQLPKVAVYKITSRYAIFHAIIAQPFIRLHHPKITDTEKERLLHFFICATLFDDFFDNPGYTLPQLERILLQPEACTPQHDLESLFIASNKRLSTYAILKPGYLNVKKSVYYAQVDSLKQMQPTITDEDLKEITYRKGGSSVLLSRYYLDVPSNAEEEQCWYQLGALIQLGNDIFDLFKDLQEGINTLANRSRSIHALKQELNIQAKTYHEALSRLNGATGVLRQIRFRTAIIYALSYTAIDQLQSLEKGNAVLYFKCMNRKSLIVDMEKWSNRWRMLKYMYGYSGSQLV